MVNEILVNKVMGEVLPAFTSSVDEVAISRQFVSSIKADFGIDDAELVDISASRKDMAEEYTVNTRKPYVDNQLSEYSAFPSLIDYRNKGYRSCALIPIIGNGRVASVLRLLSKEENKFSDDLLGTVQLVSVLFGFAMLYKTEASRGARLASYFDAAFNSAVPQMLVSKTGLIVKSNRSAMKAFSLTGQGRQNISELFGIEFNDALPTGGRDVYFNTGDSHNIYRVSSMPASEGMLHVSAVNVTGKAVMDSMLSSLSDSRDLYVLFTKNDFTIISASQNFEKAMKYSNAMLYGRKFMDFLKETDAQNAINAVSGGKTIISSLQLNLLAGDYIMPIKATFSKLPFGYLVTAVSAEAEAYVHEAEENISSFIESTSDIALKVDRLGYIRECNLPVEGMLGYAKDELIGREARSLYDDPKKFDADIAYVSNGTKVDNSYVHLIKKDTGLVPCVQAVRLLRGSRDKEGYLVIIKELETRRKLSDLEAELKKAQAETKRSDAVSTQKSEFIYDITHELKTPLTNIKGFSSLLYEGQAGELSQAQKDHVSTIIEEANRLVLIIQQVLDAAKLEARKAKLEFRDVDLRALYTNPAIRSLQESARQKGLEFSWNVSYDVPVIQADQNKLVQVFVNLVGNAIKFTNSGGIKVNMLMRTKNKVECDVIDTGIGIADEDKKRLFKKFYQAPNKELTRQEQQGTGLGLAITRSIVEQHGGKIGFESKPGSGSRFWFVLPVKKQKQRQQS